MSGAMIWLFVIAVTLALFIGILIGASFKIPGVR